MSSSLGFHTMTLTRSLTYYDYERLLFDFKTYSEKTPLKMYRKKDKNYVLYTPSEDYIPIDIKIYFDGRDHGIQWHIYWNSHSEISEYTVEARINPKLLAGVTNYLIAANYDDMNIAISNFYFESKKISPLLGKFNDYRIKSFLYTLNRLRD